MLCKQQRVIDMQEDYRAGLIASILANANRDTAKRPTPYSAAYFFPSLRDLEATPSSNSAPTMSLAESLKAKVVGINALLGGRDMRKSGTD